jgi:hypothetical protein
VYYDYKFLHSKSQLPFMYFCLINVTHLFNISWLAYDHRKEDGPLIQPEMLRLSCRVKFSTFEPLPEYRKLCPYMLVISKGAHPHPIPFPQKTPSIVRSEIFRLLETIKEDLPDLTSQCFLCHPVLKSYLVSRFPDTVNPTLSDLHISLANRSHLRAYIDQAKREHFPAGTGWNGACDVLREMILL